MQQTSRAMVSSFAAHVLYALCCLLLFQQPPILFADNPIFVEGYYSASHITTKGHALLMLALKTQFNLTEAAMAFVGRILELHIPPHVTYKPELCVTKYKMAKRFEYYQSKSQRIYYCDECHAKMPGPDVLLCDCPNARVKFMIVLDLEEELRFRLEGNHFLHAVSCLSCCRQLCLTLHVQTMGTARCWLRHVRRAARRACLLMHTMDMRTST